MGRKFQLCHKKNQERKKYNEVAMLPVSIPLSAVVVLPVSIPLSALKGYQKDEDQDSIDVRTDLTVSFPLEYFTAVHVSNLSALRTRLTVLQPLPSDWADATVDSEELTLCRISHHSSVVTPSISFTFKVANDLSWTLFFYNQRIEADSCPALASTQSVISSLPQLSELLAVVSDSCLCVGNPDDRFRPLLTRRQGVFMDQHGTRVVASEDTQSLGYATIRHSSCSVLLPKDTGNRRCEQCQAFRSVLRAQLSRHMKADSSDRTNPSSHVRYSCLDKEELTSRLRQVKSFQKDASRKVKQLEVKLAAAEAAIERASHTVDEETHSDLVSIVEQQSSVVAKQFPPNSFAHVFWHQQLKAATRPNSRGMRWHPLMIKWALYLQYQSAGAYETIRNYVALPSQRTLRDYSHHTKAHIGFSDEADKQLMSIADVLQIQDWQKYVILLMDEMHIREDLVYDKHTGALLGFTNLGDINGHLDQFERSLETNTISECAMAKTMLVIMVRGLFTKLQYPYAQFPSVKLSGDQIFDPFWEAVYRVERCTLKVVGATFDGASPNRRFVKLHGIAQPSKRSKPSKPSELSEPSQPSKPAILHKVLNPYADDGRMLFFFSDPPHLLKTTRNCWSSKARQLWNNGKPIAWKHLEDLYLGDCGAQKDQPGLSLVPKLKYEHIHLTSFSKMRVDLAAQVLSNTVATALRLTGKDEVEETARFVTMIDRFFDCLNVTDFDSGRRTRNPFKAPYRSGNDFRLRWLEDEFLPFLDAWEKSVEEREGFTDAEKNRMKLSTETLLGLRITVKSFLDLVRFLFTVPGVKFFLSRRLCQDPIEKFFGCQRQRGRTHDNPNAAEFLQNTQALRVVNGFCRDVAKGNCRGNKVDAQLGLKENTPLPKRQQKREQKRTT